MLRVLVCKRLVGELGKYKVLLAAKETVEEGHNFARLSDPPLLLLCLLCLSEFVNSMVSIFHDWRLQKLFAIGLRRSLVIALDLSQGDWLRLRTLVRI